MIFFFYFFIHPFMNENENDKQVKEMLAAGKIGGDAHTIVANVTSKMGSVSDNGSGGTYAYRASKCALNIGRTMKKGGLRTNLFHFLIFCLLFFQSVDLIAPPSSDQVFVD